MSIQALRANLAHAREEKYEFAVGLQADEVEAALAEVAELEAKLAEAKDDIEELTFCEDCGEDETKLQVNNCWPPRYCHSCRHKLVMEICQLRKRAEKGATNG